MAYPKFGCGMPHGDKLLEEIQRLYHEEMPAVKNHRETPEYKALIKRIRALVEEWKKIHGDEDR